MINIYWIPLLSRLYTGVILSSLNQSTSLTLSPGMLLVMLHGRDTELPIITEISDIDPVVIVSPSSNLLWQDIINNNNNDTLCSLTIIMTFELNLVYCNIIHCSQYHVGTQSPVSQLARHRLTHNTTIAGGQHKTLTRLTVPVREMCPISPPPQH